MQLFAQAFDFANIVFRVSSINRGWRTRTALRNVPRIHSSDAIGIRSVLLIAKN